MPQLRQWVPRKGQLQGEETAVKQSDQVKSPLFRTVYQISEELHL